MCKKDEDSGRTVRPYPSYTYPCSFRGVRQTFEDEKPILVTQMKTERESPDATVTKVHANNTTNNLTEYKECISLSNSKRVQCPYNL